MLHLANFQSFSQQTNPSKEVDLPSFEEAFDTDSLKKFFQEHDSHLSTPFTTYSETPLYEDLHSTLTDAKSMFGSPMNRFINVPVFNLGSEVDDAFNAKTFGVLDKKSFGFEEREDGMTKNKSQPTSSAFSEEKENEQVKVRQIMNDQSSLRINLSGGSSSFVFLRNTREDSDLLDKNNDNLRELEEDEAIQIREQIDPRIDIDVQIKKKKAIFIIERNVIPKTISKKPKVERKASILIKRKKSEEIEKTEDKKACLKKEKKEKTDKTEKTEKANTEKNEKKEKKASKKNLDESAKTKKNKSNKAKEAKEDKN